MHDLLDDLRAADPAAGHDLTAIDPRAFADLRDAVLANPRPVRGRPSRWVGAGLAVAAVTTAALLLTPGALSPRPIEATPARTPAPAAQPGTWQPTATPPLSARYGSVAVWVDDSFLVVGGLAEAPCVLTGAAGCPQLPDVEALRDGARYDPATDSWTSIAAAPRGIVVGSTAPDPFVAVVGHKVYLVAPTPLVYDTDTDSWDSFDLTHMVSLLVWHDQLVAFNGQQCRQLPYAYPSDPCKGQSSSFNLRYDAAARKWIVEPVPIAMPEDAQSAVIVGDTFAVAGGLAAGGSRLALVDLRSGDGVQRDSAVHQGSVVAVDGRIGWLGEDIAEFLDPASPNRVWTRVGIPSSPGTFTGWDSWNTGEPQGWPIVVGGLVALNGHLYDPATGLWSPTTALPVPARAPVIAGGPDSALACWGYDPAGASLGEGCYLLVPGEATATTAGG